MPAREALPFGPRRIAGGDVRPNADRVRGFRRTFSPPCLPPTAVRGRTARGETTCFVRQSPTQSALFLSTLACCAVSRTRRSNPGALKLESLFVTAARWPQRQLRAHRRRDGDRVPKDRSRWRAKPRRASATRTRRRDRHERRPRIDQRRFLRGANTNQTLVLIDGQRIGSSTSGTAPLEAIPLEAIDHIEILRGPASNLYGADAIGGVIQVFTRNAGAAFAAHASAGYGTYRTSDVSGGVSGADGAWRYSLDARTQTKRRVQFDRQSGQCQLQRRPRRLSRATMLQEACRSNSRRSRSCRPGF